MSDTTREPDPLGNEQAIAERTDDDVIGEQDFPPDEPRGVERWGTTAVEEEGGESVRRRATQEDPRRDLRGRPPAHAGLLEPDDEMGEDLTAESIAVEGDDPDRLTAEEEAVHLVDEQVSEI